MELFIAELIGTMVLIILGQGVVANVNLNKTLGEGTGLIAIILGWCVAVFAGVFIAVNLTPDGVSGGHINPAVTIGQAIAGVINWGQVPIYLSGQFLGAALGAFFSWLQYKDHFAITEDKATKLGVFATAPAIRNTVSNVISETLGTFVLMFSVFYISGASVGDQSASLGALDALPVALVVLGIGVSLGGTTGYAINPARDLSPRLMHAILPIPNKGDSDWSYAWIPVIGPILGAVLAAGLFIVLG